MNDKEQEKDRVESIASMLLAALYGKYGVPRALTGRTTARKVLEEEVAQVIFGAKELVRQLDKEYK